MKVLRELLLSECYVSTLFIKLIEILFSFLAFKSILVKFFSIHLQKKKIFFEKPLGVVNIYLLKMSVMESTVDFTNIFPFTEVVLILQTPIDKTLSEKKTRILVIVKP